MGMREMCEMLDNHFEVRIVSEEDYIRRMSDPRYHYEAVMKTAKPLRSSERVLIEEGLSNLRGIIAESIEYLGLTGREDELWCIYNKLRDAVNSQNKVLVPMVEIGEALYSRILNIGWLYALVWQLPALDPANKNTYSSLGKTALAMFYMDQLWYRTDGGEGGLERWFNDNDHSKLDALHAMVTE